MAINDSQKVDFLWKKIIYGVTETDIEGKGGPNETISSPVATYSKDIWAQAEEVPVPAPLATVGVVEYVTLKCTADPTVAGNVTWLATTTFGDILTLVGDWVPPTFDPAYLAEVWAGEPGNGGTKLNSGSAGVEWVFDYVAGTLHFPNASGSGDIWLVAHRYVGDKGLTGSSVGPEVVITKEYATIELRDADTEVKAGQFAVVADAGDGEGAVYVANTDGPAGQWTLISTDDSADLDAKTIQGVIPFSADAETTLGNASAGSRVVNISIDVSVAFDGAADLTVGIDGQPDLLVSADDIDLSASGTYEISSKYTFTNQIDTDVKVYFSNGGTTGSATVAVTFA